MQTVKFNNHHIIPSKIVCVGRNYVEHIKELNNEMPKNMVLFNKPNSAISSDLYYFDDTRFEGEICFIIKNKQIAGVGVGLDLTNAKIQDYLKSKGLPWERAKAFNKSAVFSEFIDIKDTKNLEMKLYINNTLTQHATYELMIYKPNEILEEILTFMDLEDGDIIMSGTPKGVGYYKKGDVFRFELFNNTKILEKEFISI